MVERGPFPCHLLQIKVTYSTVYSNQEGSREDASSDKGHEAPVHSCHVGMWAWRARISNFPKMKETWIFMKKTLNIVNQVQSLKCTASNKSVALCLTNVLPYKHINNRR